MKRVLIISPSFPPINAADMHRVRQSLPHFREFGWEPTVLAVRPELVEAASDEDLLATVPPDADVRHVGALDYRWTRMFGLGSLGLRSLPHYAFAGDRLLRNGEYDLVYFSTTMFPVLILGAYWQRRHGVPFVIDMQDPWHNEYYQSRPRSERPPKYWFSYRLNKFLEPVAMRSVAGLVSVSDGYCTMLRDRYPELKGLPCSVIPFGGASADFTALERTSVTNDLFQSGDDNLNVVYVGRGGHDMAQACGGIFSALRLGLKDRPDLFERIRMHFVGTDYAPDGRGRKTIEPIAEQFGVADHVKEWPVRVPYFKVLRLLRDSDMVIIPGSDDPNYTASKLYPYILAQRPILAVFSETSSVVDILSSTGAGEAVTFRAGEPDDDLGARVHDEWVRILEALPFTPDTDWDAFEPYTAREMTRRQVELFDRVLESKGTA